MKNFAGTLTNRWNTMRAHVGQLVPRRAIAPLNWLQARVTGEPGSPAIVSHAADWWLASLLVVAGPLLIATLLLAAVCGGGLWDCAPIWSDEIGYFNEMSIFAFTGWTGGYTVCQEWPARVEWVRFGTHGPFVPVIYGTLARVLGVNIATIPSINVSLLVLGSVFWVAACRPNLRQAWAAALVAVTFWPLILYVPTSMQEGLHFAIAFVLAALATLLVRNAQNRWILLLALAGVAAAAQTRVTWAWVAVPMLWVAMRPRSIWQAALWAAASLAIVITLYLEAVALVSPFPNFMKSVLDGAAEWPIATCHLLVEHTLKGIERYFAPNHDTVLQIALRYQVLLILGVAIYQLRKAYKQSKNGGAAEVRDSGSNLAAAAYWFALLNLLCIVGFVIAFYDVRDWRDYRVVAPHLLLTLLVLVSCGVFDWLKGYAILAAAVSVAMVLQFAEFHRPRVAFDSAPTAAAVARMNDVIEFQPGAAGWDNTLLMDAQSMAAPELLALPRGIGISIVVDWSQQAWPPRSKYVLLTTEQAKTQGIPASMRKVAEISVGDIYMRR